MAKIWAAEPNAIQEYLEKRETVSPEMRMKYSSFPAINIEEDSPLAKSMFDRQSGVDLLEISGYEATININGVLNQDGPDWIDNLFGLAVTGYNQLIEAIDLIKGDETIKNVRLMMDTPGGEASGCDLVNQALKDLSSKVTLTAFNLGMIASAGYWLASAAHHIIATTPTNETGSIGVLITGFDFSEFLAKEGIKFVKIRSQNAPKKAPGISTKEDIELLRLRINDIEAVFISRVAEGRNTTEKDVISNFGKGSVLIAQHPNAKMPDAVKVGMIDSVISKLKENTKTKTNQIKSQTLKEDKMDFTQVLADNPGLKEHIDKLKSDARQEGVDATNKEVELRVAKAKPILTSESYPAMIKEHALKVVTGESTIDSLETITTMHDINVEEAKKKAAEAEAAEDTPPDGPKKAESGNVDSVESYNAEIAKAKAAQGRDNK